ETGDVDGDGREIVQNRNVNRSEIAGVEAAVSWQASDSLQFGFVSNYTFGEDQTGGQEFPGDRIPPLHGELSATYQHDSPWRFKSFVRFASAQNRLSPRDTRDNRIDPNGTPGWATLNFEVGYEAEQWSIQARAENVFDRSYRHHGSGVDATGHNLTAQFRLRF
ncbi:MAG: TonB-dependent receptor, partial [Pseudomonadota bacterium]